MEADKNVDKWKREVYGSVTVTRQKEIKNWDIEGKGNGPSREIFFFFVFFLSGRKEIVLKRDAKIATQKNTKEMHPPPWLGHKNSRQKQRSQKNHPHRYPTQSMKPTKVEGPSFMNNFISDHIK